MIQPPPCPSCGSIEWCAHAQVPVLHRIYTYDELNDDGTQAVDHISRELDPDSKTEATKEGAYTDFIHAARSGFLD